MNVAIIGAHGVVGRTLCEHMSFLGHVVAEVDRDTPLTIEEASHISEVIFVATLPLSEIQGIIMQVARSARPSSLIVNCASVEKPLSKDVLDAELLLQKNITLCHCHFHFRPQIPLSRTLHGNAITVSFNDAGDWSEWIDSQLVPFGPRMMRLNPGEHDKITSVSQLTHMMVVPLVGTLWKNHDKETIEKALELGGFPFQSLMRSVFRTASSGKVPASILQSHPYAHSEIERFLRASENLLKMHTNNVAVESMMTHPRSFVDTEILKSIDDSIASLVRLDADIKKCGIAFHFPKEKNVHGLLARVLNEFDTRGIDKTTTHAQKNVDGGCTFIIGVDTRDERVEEAIRSVEMW